MSVLSKENISKIGKSIKKLFKMNFNPEIDSLEFIVIDTVDGIDIMVYSLDFEGNEFYGDFVDCCFSGSEKLIENIKLDGNISMEEKINEFSNVLKEIIESLEKKNNIHLKLNIFNEFHINL